MKILMVTPFFPPDYGGISYHVSNIAGRLSQKHEITIVTCGVHSGYEQKNNLKITRILSITPPAHPYQTLSSFRIPISLNKLAWSINIEDFDVIHAHGHHYPVSWLTIYLAKAKDMPTVLTAHGMYALTWHKTFIEEIFNTTLLKFLLTKLDGIIGVTPTVVNYLKKYGLDKGNYCVIPNGVDLYLYRKNLHRKLEYRTKYGIPHEKIVILYRGRLVDVKGVREFTNSISIINTRQKYRDKVYFVICGGGPLKDEILQRLGQAKNCKFFNWTPSERVHELYIASDAYILPTKWYEAFSITLLEAMAANLYIIATPVGGIPDVLVHHPRKKYINSFSPVEIAKAITKFLNENHKIRNNDELLSFTNHIIRFDWSYIVREIENVYTNVSNVS